MDFLTIMNAIATFLTIETGVFSNMHVVADAVSARKMAQLSCRVDYEKVSKDMEPFYSTLDDYTSKYFNENKNIISSNEREHFIDKYFEMHPEHKMRKEFIKSYLNGFLDDLEAVLEKELTVGERITYRKMVELLRTHQEMAKEVQKTLDKISTNEDDFSPVRTPDLNYDIDVLDFLMIRQLEDGLFVNWRTGCLTGDFWSALDRRDRDGNALPALSSSQVRLLSVLVQGEGAVVSWRDLFRRGKLITKWQEKYAKTEPTATGRANPSSEVLQREPTQEEIEEIVTASINDLQNRIVEAVERIGMADSETVKDMFKKANTKKGFRIELYPDKTKIREKAGSRKSLFSGNGDFKGYTEYDDFTLLTEEIEEKGHTRCREVSAWLRRYYDRACRFFENRVSNIGEEDTDSSEKEIFGEYTMVQAYMIPYVSIGKDRWDEEQSRKKEEIIQQEVVSAKDRYEIGPETMLDYVERWHSEEGDAGRVLVLHGQPGDGKTTFCRKAVYAHCREGWLANTPHVFRFSLNPADNEIIEKSGIHFENVFSIYDEEGRRFPLSLMNFKNIPRGNRRQNMLQGSLIILDGYDELEGSMRNSGVSIEFDTFYRKAVDFARNQKCNVIITSRTMCIESDLKGEVFRDYKKAPFAAFGPLTEEQQDAMIDRMIELDASTEDRDEPEVCETGCSREKSGTDSTVQNDSSAQKVNDISLEDYRKEILLPLRESIDRREKDFKELLKVPILFRMIVQKRFNSFKEMDTAAELYGRLFSDLLSQKKYDEVTELPDRLTRFYEEVAIGIFNYGMGTCPIPRVNSGVNGEVKNAGNMNDNRKLVYYFYTKKGENGGEQLGFLHNSFFQYFLARYIISSVRELGVKMLKEKNHPEGVCGPDFYRLLPNDFIKLFASLRAEKLADPDLWKLVTQLAVIEQSIENHSSGNKVLINHTWEERIQPAHVMCILECLNQNCLCSNLMLSEDSYERKAGNTDQDGGWSYRRYREMEYAVFNLLSACAAIESGCIEGAKKYKSTGLSSDQNQRIRISYGGNNGYHNLCELLRRGDYSRIYLSGINLDNCHLGRAMLSGAHLSGVNLNGAHLDGADLSRATLSEAKFHKAELAGASLKGAVLKDAVLESAKMKGANLHGAILNGAKMSFLHMEGADLKGADLKDAMLESAHMEKADLEGANLRKAHLENAFLTGANMAGSNLENAFLTGANMAGSNLEGAHLEGAHLEGADLGHACLREACLAGAWLTGAKLERACLEGACLDKAHLNGAEFFETCMKEAFLAGSELDEKALKSMEGADLKRAVFDEAKFEQAEGFGMPELRTRTQTRKMHIQSAALRDRLVLSVGDRDSFVRNSGRNSFMAVSGRGAHCPKNEYGISKGDRVWFGRYPQDNKSEDGKFFFEPLLWRVLHVDQKKGRALLITEKLIDCVPYHERFEYVTWEHCTLRKWMNDDFFCTAFTPEEASLIARVWCQNHDNPYDWKGHTLCSNATYDRVFALSIREADGIVRNRNRDEESYFEEDNDRRATVTYYAKERGSYIDNKCKVASRGTGWWWLRSPGRDSDDAALVFTNGSVSADGYGVDFTRVSVRPALWIYL